MTHLVLTHPGRKTGRHYRTGLFYGEDAGRCILVASGSAVTHTHPQWYLTWRPVRRCGSGSSPTGSTPAPALPRVRGGSDCGG